MSNKRAIIEHYLQNDEDGRLFSNKAYSVAYHTTIRYLNKLINKKSKILDCCAGTGIYSIYLAKKEHEVYAFDLCNHHVEILRNKPESKLIKDIQVYDILNMNEYYDEEQFDIILNFGSLYHLNSDEDRKQVIEKCSKLLKHDGLLFNSFINKTYATIASLHQDFNNLDGCLKFLTNDIKDVFSWTDANNINNITEQCGFETLFNVRLNGLSYLYQNEINSMSEENFKKYLEYHFLTCENEDLLGASCDNLSICQKV